MRILCTLLQYVVELERLKPHAVVTWLIWPYEIHSNKRCISYKKLQILLWYYMRIKTTGQISERIKSGYEAVYRRIKQLETRKIAIRIPLMTIKTNKDANVDLFNLPKMK